MLVIEQYIDFVHFDEKEKDLDRRIKRTKELIYNSFNELLSKKKYNDITVQNIIDEADIGRSTFYSHFETKDELLKYTCIRLFDHVFKSDLISSKNHDFSVDDNFKYIIVHILHHINQCKDRLFGLLLDEGAYIFNDYLSIKLKKLFSDYFDYNKIEIPKDYVENYLIKSFIETIRWWIKDNNKKYNANEVAEYYISILQNSIIN